MKTVVVIEGLSLVSARDKVYAVLIKKALRQTSHNQMKAAQLLGISRYSLIRWRKRLNIPA